MTQTPPPASGGTDPVAGALHQVLSDYGRRVAENPARLRAMLSDALGGTAADHRAAIDALVVAAEEGVCADLASGATAPEELGPALVTRLSDWGLDAETATWAVAAWSGALGSSATLPPAVTLFPRTSLPPHLAAIAAGVTSPVPSTAPPPAASWPTPAIPFTPASSPAPARRHPLTLVAAAVAGVLLLSAGAYAFIRSDSPRVTAGDTLDQTQVIETPSETASTESASPSASAKPSVKPSVKPSPSATAVKPQTEYSPAPRRTTYTPEPRRTTRAPSPVATTRAPSPRTTTPPPPPPPPPPAKPTAYNFSTNYKPLVCDGDWCHAYMAPSTSGTWDTLTVLDASPGHADTYVRNNPNTGKINIFWHPHHNGEMSFTIPYYVVNKGVRSNTAYLSVTVQCNPEYVCYGS